MRLDEEGTMAAWWSYRRDVIDPVVDKHGGRVVKLTGDGFLAEFASATDAVSAAIAIQSEIASRVADVPEERRVQFRMGINLGDILWDDEDIYGDGVNIAARIEALAETGGIFVSASIHEQVHRRLPIGFADLGEQTLKNIDTPVRVYRIVGPDADTAADASPALTLPDKPSIAVLPFENMSGDPDQDYFADGITEDIITAFSRIRWCFVTARSSAFTFKGQATDVQEVAKELGVRYVLEGSVRKAGDHVRISAQLIDGLNGNHLWAERYDRDLRDIFALQDEITETVLGAIEPEIARAERERAKAKRPENLDAWDLLLRSRAKLYTYTKEAVAEAVTLSLRAIESDPAIAQAHSTLAYAYQRQLLLNYVDDREAVRDLLTQAAMRAVALDKEDVEGHAVLGLALWQSGDADEALSALETAIELGPSHAFAHSTLGLAMGTSGFAEEALEHHQTAIRLSPRDSQMALYLSRYANSCINAHRYEQAVALSRKAIRLSGGDLWLAFVEAATALALLGQIDAAREMVTRINAIRPNASVAAVRAAFSFKRADDEKHYMDGLRTAGLAED